MILRFLHFLDRIFVEVTAAIVAKLNMRDSRVILQLPSLYGSSHSSASNRESKTSSLDLNLLLFRLVRCAFSLMRSHVIAGSFAALMLMLVSIGETMTMRVTRKLVSTVSHLISSCYLHPFLILRSAFVRNSNALIMNLLLL